MTALSCEEVRELAAAYVLGGLSRPMADAVREHLVCHAGAHPEYGELGSVAGTLALLADPVSPPSVLKQRVLAAATATAQQRQPAEAQARPGAAATGGSAAAPTFAPASVFDSGVKRPIETRRDWRSALAARRGAVVGWSFAAAAVVAVVALVFANASLQRDASSARQYNDQLQRAVSMAAAHGSRIAVIAPAAGSLGNPGPGSSGAAAGPSGLAVIPAAGPGVLAMAGLAQTVGSSVYEAWAIVGNQAPAPIGSFAVAGDGFGWIDALNVPAGGQLVVALTMEPGPGATKPTLPIVASGAAAP